MGTIVSVWDIALKHEGIKGDSTMSDLWRELWNELNHWWMWLLILVVIAVEVAATVGWLPPDRLLPEWFFANR